MITTKAGRTIREKSSRKRTDFWQILRLRQTLAVKYVTKETLLEMGFTVREIPFSNSTEQFGSNSRLNGSHTDPSVETKAQQSTSDTNDLKNEHSDVVDLENVKEEPEPLVVKSSTEIIVID